MNTCDKYTTERNRQLKKMFENQIHGNFLIKILSKLFDEVPGFSSMVIQTFNAVPDNPFLQSTNLEVPDFEICKYIVGAHKFNTLFKTNKELNDLEDNSEYINQLKKDVVCNIKLREYSGVFYRSKQIISGDRFGFFNLIVDFFTITIYALLNINSNVLDLSDNLYSSLFNRSLAVLSLIDDNLIDDAYPSCRGMIEIYFKLLVLKCCPNIKSTFEKFINYGVNNNICLQGWGKEFEKDFSNRKFKRCNSKGDYIQYGWVDAITDYDFSRKSYPYALSSVGNYLQINFSQISNDIERLMNMYKFCNNYSHGNLARCCYQINDYFNSTFILTNILPYAFELFCSSHCLNPIINDIDILDKIKHDIQIFYEAYEKRTTENFEMYYQRLKNNVNQ